MAFFNRAGSIIRQAVSIKHIHQEISASSSLVFQAIRCMSSKVFVGGLSYSIDEPTLRDEFSKYGEVQEAKIIYDRESGNSRGFGFVTYTTSEEATSAIQALDGKDLSGRVVRVNLATERARTPGFGGGGYGGGGGGYGGGGGGYGGGGGGYGGGGYGGNSGYRGGGYGGGDSSAGGGYGGGDSGAGGGYGGANNYGGSYGNQGISGGGGYDSGSNVGFGNNSQNLGVGVGTEYADGGAIGQTGSGESSHIANAAAGYNPGVPGDFKDDEDEPEDFAGKRA